jgi:hypothetical protein
VRDSTPTPPRSTRSTAERRNGENGDEGELRRVTALNDDLLPEHGIYDLRSTFGTDDCQIRTAQEFGLPGENRERFAAASSITDAGGIDKPPYW